MQVELVSPERILFSGEAEMVICRTISGDIAFLDHHAPFIGALDVWELRIKTATGETKAAVHGGFVEVRDNRVIILSDLAELADQIDVERARRRMADLEKSVEKVDDTAAEAMLRRDHVRLVVTGAL